MNEIATIKVFDQSRKKLRLIAAHTEETQPEVIERLLAIELEKIEKKKAKIINIKNNTK